MARRINQRGAASLFAVIFSTLLLTVLALGFIKLMLVDQRQAINSDLSQSAYDAALAGVEDAKRVVRAAHQGDLGAIRALSDHGDKCNVIHRSGVVAGSNDGETIIRSNSLGTGDVFDQAYTCVKIKLNTEDFLYKSVKDRSQVIPLKASGDFNRIVIEWYKRDDEENPGNADATNPKVGERLPKEGAATWGANTPSLIRAQLINPGENFDLGSFDATGVTVFLRPRVLNTSPVTASELNVSLRPRATDGEAHNNDLDQAICDKKFSFSGVYSCRAVLYVGGISQAASANAFLRLNSLYKGSSVRVYLMNDSAVVGFDGAQPAVDSTGRSNNLFRRVEARLQIGDDFAYPDNAVEIINSLCKDFSVANSLVIAGSCRP